ncbi:hypothetical protein LP414_19575 [Polaromonas sp. P1(28)-13]|nr:hypothetical protein LP414_19575 [Polaromonas sp. P1(28)-13]
MVDSSIDQLLECILPCELRRLGLFSHASIDEFLAVLADAGDNYPIRFVAIDGTHEAAPGKSGAVVIREFQRHARISKRLTCRPEHIVTLPATVKCLIYVDDMLGTGKQFNSFAKHYSLEKQSQDRKQFYCPLIAHQDGVGKVEMQNPWLMVRPVELLDQRHSFLRAADVNKTLWAVDQKNAVNDVIQHLQALCSLKYIPGQTKFSLNLLLGFEHATPNNTLPIMWARSSSWHPLLIR